MIKNIIIVIIIIIILVVGGIVYFLQFNKGDTSNFCTILRSFRDTKTGECIVLTKCGTPASRYITDPTCKI